ncbi:hypothetical protein ACFL2Q_02910 [Thermodesulfobacteriota bacterium]
MDKHFVLSVIAALLCFVAASAFATKVSWKKHYASGISLCKSGEWARASIEADAAIRKAVGRYGLEHLDTAKSFELPARIGDAQGGFFGGFSPPQ